MMLNWVAIQKKQLIFCHLLSVGASAGIQTLDLGAMSLRANVMKLLTAVIYEFS